MSDDHRTPEWWRALPTWIQVLTLALWLPGVVAHELVHGLTAARWADWSLDWDEIACRYEWQTRHPAPRAATQIAPLVVGSALTVALLATVAGQPGSLLGAGIGAYIAVNLAVFTVASAADLVGFVTAILAWALGERYPAETDTDTPSNHG